MVRKDKERKNGKRPGRSARQRHRTRARMRVISEVAKRRLRIQAETAEQCAAEVEKHLLFARFACESGDAKHALWAKQLAAAIAEQLEDMEILLQGQLDEDAENLLDRITAAKRRARAHLAAAAECCWPMES